MVPPMRCPICPRAPKPWQAGLAKAPVRGRTRMCRSCGGRAAAGCGEYFGVVRGVVMAVAGSACRWWKLD